MGWSRVTVTGNLSLLSSICVPLLVMAQRALRGLPESQAPTRGLAACAHPARHTYLPHQKVPSASLTSPIPVLMPLDPLSPWCSHLPIPHSTEGQKVGASPCAYTRDAGCPRAPGQSLGGARERPRPGGSPREGAPGSGQSGGQGKQDKAYKWRGQQGEPEGPRKGLPGSWPGEATVPFLPCLRSSVLLTSLSRPCQSCPGSGLPQPLA